MQRLNINYVLFYFQYLFMLKQIWPPHTPQCRGECERDQMCWLFELFLHADINMRAGVSLYVFYSACIWKFMFRNVNIIFDDVSSVIIFYSDIGCFLNSHTFSSWKWKFQYERYVLLWIFLNFELFGFSLDFAQKLNK